MTKRVDYTKTQEPVPSDFAKGEWTPTRYTIEEGGHWYPIKAGEQAPSNATIIKYRNGCIFDSYLRGHVEFPWRRY